MGGGGGTNNQQCVYNVLTTLYKYIGTKFCSFYLLCTLTLELNTCRDPFVFVCREMEASRTPLSEAEFEEIMNRNRAISSSAISRAVSDASAGNKQSNIGHILNKHLLNVGVLEFFTIKTKTGCQLKLNATLCSLQLTMAVL